MLRVPVEYPELSDCALYLLAEYHFSKARYLDAARVLSAAYGPPSQKLLGNPFLLRKSQALLEAGSYSPAAESFDKFEGLFPFRVRTGSGAGFRQGATGDGKLDRAAGLP